MSIPADNPVTVEGVELGRFLFYDSILSRDYTFSCATCHQQQYAFTDAPKAFSVGIKGTPLNRNTMPLFNLAWSPTLFWDGRATSLEQQVFHPVRAHDEMNLSWKEATKRIQKSKFYRKKFQLVFGTAQIDSTHIAKAIAQFERTLLSYQSKYDKVFKGNAVFTPQEREGFELINNMTKGDCLHCHTTDADALGTTFAFSNNGLDAIKNTADFKDRGRAMVTRNEKDAGKFKIPSLRNLLFTAPYMHDGRFRTLEEVVDFYSEGLKSSITIDNKMEFIHQGGAKLSKHEKACVIAFLKTLTDSAFIQNKAFSNPFLLHTK